MSHLFTERSTRNQSVATEAPRGKGAGRRDLLCVFVGIQAARKQHAMAADTGLHKLGRETFGRRIAGFIAIVGDPDLADAVPAANSG